MQERLHTFVEHLSDDNMVDLVSHAGEDYLDDDNERADKLNKMGHSRRLKAIKDCTYLCRTSTGGEHYRENVSEALI